MNCLVTGAAGFIGSHLAEKLLANGHQVLGIDGFIEYYPRFFKERNLDRLLKQPGFSFREANLLEVDLVNLIKDVEIIFHQAAQAGVRGSWGDNFELYTSYNILATQKLLEAAKVTGLKKFIYASSSSVYGNTDILPMKETNTLRPLSPYGVSKLAAENLCFLYYKNYGVPTVALRYFTVYGPRQRPDMAFHKFIKAILEDREIVLYGEGNQTRDFTYIDDIVQANILAMESAVSGQVFNIGGGSRVTLNKAIAILGKLLGKPRISNELQQKGDVDHTLSDITLAAQVLGYEPRVSLEEGLFEEINWLRKINKTL